MTNKQKLKKLLNQVLDDLENGTGFDDLLILTVGCDGTEFGVCASLDNPTTMLGALERAKFNILREMHND